MNILIDTHIALWAVTLDPRLTPTAQNLLLSNIPWVSVASLWEIAIKHSSKPASMPLSAKVAFQHFSSAGFRLLDISIADVQVVEALPWHHKDPFDRLLVAQALVNSMHLVTHDQTVAMYGPNIISV